MQAFFNYFLQVERTLRVRGDLHIGGLMIRLVDELGKKLGKKNNPARAHREFPQISFPTKKWIKINKKL